MWEIMHNWDLKSRSFCVLAVYSQLDVKQLFWIVISYFTDLTTTCLDENTNMSLDDHVCLFLFCVFLAWNCVLSFFDKQILTINNYLFSLKYKNLYCLNFLFLFLTPKSACQVLLIHINMLMNVVSALRYNNFLF